MLFFDVSCHLYSSRHAANGRQATPLLPLVMLQVQLRRMHQDHLLFILANLPIPFSSSTKKTHSKTNAQPPRSWIEDSLENPFSKQA